MTKTPVAKIAAAMIVKNEQAMLKDCLDSLRGFVQVLSIQDTGSTDATLAIIAAWGKDHPEVQVILTQEPWREDFSWHRNAAFATVPKDVDWVLIIDADERLGWHYNTGHRLLHEGTDREVSAGELPVYAPGFFRAWLVADSEVATYDCLAAMVNDYHGEGTPPVYNASPRLFRRFSAKKKNRPGVRYQSTVHNKAVWRGPMLVPPMLSLTHYGYGPMVDQEAKRRQRIPMMLKALKDGDQQMQFFLAEQYGMLGELEVCMLYATGYRLQRQALGKEFNTSVYYLGAKTALGLKRTEEALEWLQEGLKLLPEDPDLLFTLSDVGQKLGRDDLTLTGAQGYLAAYEKGPAACGGRLTFSLRPDCKALARHRLTCSLLRAGIKSFYMELDGLARIEPGLRQRILDELGALMLTFDFASMPSALPLGVGLGREAKHAA